jgi:hypothetical protein
MDRLRSLVRKLLALVVRRETRVVAVTDDDPLGRARRALDAGQLDTAWTLYRDLPLTRDLLSEVYDVACALSSAGADDQAAELFHRVAQLDG